MLVLGFYARRDTSTRSRGNIYFIRYLSIKRKAMILMKIHFFVIFRNFRPPPLPQWNFNVNELWKRCWPAPSLNRSLALWKASPSLIGVDWIYLRKTWKFDCAKERALFQCFLLRHSVLHCICNQNESGHRICRCWDTSASQAIRPISNYWLQSGREYKYVSSCSQQFWDLNWNEPWDLLCCSDSGLHCGRSNGGKGNDTDIRVTLQ